ncbi:hypothetical protein ABEF95_009091 [Exophiala dermatitidis]|uniref:Uncharacterized protein n=1 Tax=Exophiala dermatitidis (strain ATCC 34100 / CBS 525.76 / NIH/UT8656) TaxID=858893 RepID=H6CBB5_EXODN|nr:uncharacterized protein HMPREF1120_09002 [Exophiala dermatitidis NIH/UT8656]EHY61062.1 hypothetical protein HMPREF1120_09002 [Exophiala dermatitidis NIH/UT8656]
MPKRLRWFFRQMSTMCQYYAPQRGVGIDTRCWYLGWARWSSSPLSPSTPSSRVRQPAVSTGKERNGPRNDGNHII